MNCLFIYYYYYVLEWNFIENGPVLCKEAFSLFGPTNHVKGEDVQQLVQPNHLHQTFSLALLEHNFYKSYSCTQCNLTIVIIMIRI